MMRGSHKVCDARVVGLRVGCGRYECICETPDLDCRNDGPVRCHEVPRGCAALPVASPMMIRDDRVRQARNRARISLRPMSRSARSASDRPSAYASC